MTQKKNPSFLASSDKVNATQRKSLGLGKYAKRTKGPNEAGPITYTSSKLTVIPKMEATRPGADDHLRIGRRGYFC